MRYLIVETGSWLQSRKVLITPHAVGVPDTAEQVIPVRISCEQVRGSPDIDTDQPVSRQHETDHLGYYGYPPYWGGAGMWGGDAFPGMMGSTGIAALPVLLDPDTQAVLAEASARRHAHDNPHLRSCKSVHGYHLRATDGEIGHVAGYIVDDQTWAIRFLVVDTRNWWPGQKVLIAPDWISGVSWEDATVDLRSTRDAVRSAPAFDPDALPTAEQESAIHQHHRQPNLG